MVAPLLQLHCSSVCMADACAVPVVVEGVLLDRAVSVVAAVAVAAAGAAAQLAAWFQAPVHHFFTNYVLQSAACACLCCLCVCELVF